MIFDFPKYFAFHKCSLCTCTENVFCSCRYDVHFGKETLCDFLDSLWLLPVSLSWSMIHLRFISPLILEWNTMTCHFTKSKQQSSSNLRYSLKAREPYLLPPEGQMLKIWLGSEDRMVELQRRLMYSFSRSSGKIRFRYRKSKIQDWDIWVDSLRILASSTPPLATALSPSWWQKQPAPYYQGDALHNKGLFRGHSLPLIAARLIPSQVPVEPGKRNGNPALGRNACIAKEL